MVLRLLRLLRVLKRATLPKLRILVIGDRFMSSIAYIDRFCCCSSISLQYCLSQFTVRMIQSHFGQHTLFLCFELQP